MQDTLHHLRTTKSPFPYPKSHNHDFSSLSCPKSLHFPSLSSKTTTIALPHKPPKTPENPTIYPQLPPSPPRHHTLPPVEFQEKMLYLDSIGLDIFHLVAHHRPIILSASLADIKSTVDYLTFMKFTTLEFQRIVSMCPEILNSTLSTITPIFTFLLREAGVDGSDLNRVINRRPRLLVSSVKHRLRPTLYFLQRIGIAEVKKHTYLLSCSVEDKLIPRIEYWEKIGFCHRDAISMFRRFPQLFNYSIRDNIEPKLNYFVMEMGRDLKELKEFPQYFSFSLENRIKPRHQCCVEKGVCFPLRSLLKASDSEFRERLSKFRCNLTSLACCTANVALVKSKRILVH
ncbi:hypothetical protein K2173_024180 [Erythroxylum novogranatense]|uniref:Uncharacterized protein n=1 Tax=Erythroxylum novogranatense TaxID=1862640 RepID=A0AAV8UC65_9ROSI|nr:hypothetical protein K2173_024180 [Erythroxylum novogranatense]